MALTEPDEREHDDLEPFADLLDPTHSCATLWEEQTYPDSQGRIVVTGRCACLGTTTVERDTIL